MSPRQSAPILDHAELRAFAQKQRAAGRSLVLSNGAFDLLHVGHVRYLQGAAQEGDVLLVAVNSDRSVRRAKGASRPVVCQHERAELVAALSVVDVVHVFDEPDVGALIDALHPDVHAKGTDYTADTVPEAAQVRRHGGRVVIVGDAKQHSTSALVDTLKKR